MISWIPNGQWRNIQGIPLSETENQGLSFSHPPNHLMLITVIVLSSSSHRITIIILIIAIFTCSWSFPSCNHPHQSKFLSQHHHHGLHIIINHRLMIISCSGSSRPAYLKFCLKGRFWGDCIPDRETFHAKTGDFGEIFGAVFGCFACNNQAKWNVISIFML